MSSVTTYPFHVFGGLLAVRTPSHLEQFPFKGDTVVGSDVWISRTAVELKWWDLCADEIADLLPLLCSPDLEQVRPGPAPTL